jgi:hypothetical protein
MPFRLMLWLVFQVPILRVQFTYREAVPSLPTQLQGSVFTKYFSSSFLRINSGWGARLHKLEIETLANSEEIYIQR